MTKPHIEGVILDVDGTLLDTEEIATRQNERVAQMFGKTYTYAVKKQMIGKAPLEAAEAFVSMLEIDITPQQFLDIRAEKLFEAFGDAKPLPGAVKLVETLKAMKVPTCIATSSTLRNFQRKLNSNGNDAHFGHLPFVTDQDITKGKPDPEIFVMAAKKIGISDHQTILVFEDSPAGVEGALAAGMHVIAVPDIRNDNPVFEKATNRLNSLEEFDFGSFDWKLTSVEE